MRRGDPREPIPRASTVALTRDLNACLRAPLGHRAYGSLKKTFAQGGGVLRSDRSRAVCETQGIRKEEAGCRQPRRSLRPDSLGRPEANGGVLLRQGRELGGAGRGARLVAGAPQHPRTPVPRTQGGRRSPSEVLGPLRVILHPVDLGCAFFFGRFVRGLDASQHQALEDLRRGGTRRAARWCCGSGPTTSPSSTRDGPLAYSTSRSRPSWRSWRMLTNPRPFATRQETPQLGLFGPDDAPAPGVPKPRSQCC